MKKVIVGKEDEEIINTLLKTNNWLFKSGDFTNIKDLFVMDKSENLTINLPILYKFDTSLVKLTKERVEFITTTKNNVIIFTDDLKLIPEGVKRVCEIIKETQIHPVMKILQKIGIDLNYEDVEDIPLGQLIKYLNVNWDKFDSKDDVFKILCEVNKRLYKVGDDWLKLYLIYGFPTQKRKTFFRFPFVRKKGLKDNIIEKIAKKDGMSVREVGKSWWLIRRLFNFYEAEKYGLDDDEMKLLGIKRIVKKEEKKKEEKEKKKYRSLVE